MRTIVSGNETRLQLLARERTPARVERRPDLRRARGSCGCVRIGGVLGTVCLSVEDRLYP